MFTDIVEMQSNKRKVGLVINRIICACIFHNGLAGASGVYMNIMSRNQEQQNAPLPEIVDMIFSNAISCHWTGGTTQSNDIMLVTNRLKKECSELKEERTEKQLFAKLANLAGLAFQGVIEIDRLIINTTFTKREKGAKT